MEKKTVLVILAHPDGKNSFNAAIARTAVVALEESGYLPVLRDLYAEGFDPVMTLEEATRPVVEAPEAMKLEMEQVKNCAGMVFVHPNWWGGPPAILRGWIDRVVRNGFAYGFTEKGAWQGTLSALETGMGYMLYTNQAKTLTFRTPSVKVRLHHKSSRPAYPNVMGIIAEVQKDGEKVEADRFTLYAYDADGECRGEGKWVNGLAYMTLYGKGGETLSYRAVDLMDGTVYAVQETMPFAEGITGSVCQPFLLTLGKVEGNATMIEGMPVAPASSEIDGYYNLNGSRVSFRTACRGIYLVKYKDGSFQKVIVK